MSGGIIRVSKTENYAVIHNQMLRDRRLSFGARGMLSYLLSRPDNWTIQVGDLIEQSPAGRDAVYGMMKELETCGYLRRDRKQGPGGKIEWEMTVYELPPSTAQPSTGKPYTDKPETVPPYTAKPNLKKELREEIPEQTKDLIYEQDANAPETTRSLKSGKSKPEADPRTKHAAISAVRGVTGYNPPKILYEQIINILGADPDMPRLSACRAEWANRGYNPKAFSWITDWYVNGIPERNGNGTGTDKKHAAQSRGQDRKQGSAGGVVSGRTPYDPFDGKPVI